MTKLRMHALVWGVVMLLGSCSKDSVEASRSPEVEIPAEAISKLDTKQDLDVLLNDIGDARYVLLGEASHGTSEYYTWRAAITRRLVQEKGFKLVAVEGDWPDAYQLNSYIRGTGTSGSARETLVQSFERWPTWMWANEEVAELAEWLKRHNQAQATDRQVGFYGLDVYSLWESMEEVQRYMRQTNPGGAQAAAAALQCFASYNRDEWDYAQAATTIASASCADELENLLKVAQQQAEASPAGDEAAFNALQNALVALNAERYYRTAIKSDVESWNVRDRHMLQTINNLAQHHGPDAKIVVWEHNTHVGDARYTDMANAGMVNVGQLVREQHAAQGVYLVGFGSYAGRVIAAERWGAPLREIRVPQAQPGTWEHILHQIPPANKIMLLRPLRQDPNLLQRRGHRAIGVSYSPGAEAGNYVPTILPERYDAFLFIDETSALRPLKQ
ncbi:erythromycin esterase family protein [Pontibacter roseus]|uniref:erythromycin esterase family protein n=1 Tax=Pontibacter roseus TaxID=336989 RepID=UPI00036833F1|nr:erythromycin esterase family protein [Pontibacter roseus]